jgi:uncharacterized protein
VRPPAPPPGAALQDIQEIITLVVFSAFSIFYLKEGIRWNHAADFLLIVAASALIFRK